MHGKLAPIPAFPRLRGKEFMKARVPQGSSMKVRGDFLSVTVLAVVH